MSSSMACKMDPLMLADAYDITFFSNCVSYALRGSRLGSLMSTALILSLLFPMKVFFQAFGLGMLDPVLPVRLVRLWLLVPWRLLLEAQLLALESQVPLLLDLLESMILPYPLIELSQFFGNLTDGERCVSINQSRCLFKL